MLEWRTPRPHPKFRTSLEYHGINEIVKLDKEVKVSVIEDAVAKIEDWKGKSVSIEPLSGGLTNTNYKVDVDGMPFFVRVPGESTELWR